MADETTYENHLTLDEIVFENRNKEYGAYDLRRSYPKILTKSMMIGTMLFLLLVVTPFIVMTIKKMNAEAKTEVDANLVEIIQDDVIVEQPEEELPPPPPPPKEEPVQQEVIQNVVPEPKKAPQVETPTPPITEQLKTTTGLVSQEGVKTPSYTPPPPPPSTGTKASTVEVAKPAVSTTEVYNEVEQLAEFPGGIDSFRNRVAQNFDSSVMDGGEGTLKTEITFVVERDGSITQVKATGSNSDFNREAERTVKSIKNKWTPAKINGQPVRYRYRLPLTMNFE
ncbi:energy transducer TonB [Bergeyella sp. RCAD1439]|uniref:energy transducer TonB n=1 Tax=Bergeyella anatis TaxID=3113737 RepID=UPI002E17393E|nr:energy transducer TonB [Bergeyella sp. RCAD1439]